MPYWKARAESKSNPLRLTPLHLASASGHVEVARLLLQRMAGDGPGQDLHSLLPLLPMASAYGHTAIIHLLLEAKADKDLSDPLGLTPLCAAAQFGHVDAVRALLEAGADRDHGSHRGLTPLQVASAKAMLP